MHITIQQQGVAVEFLPDQPGQVSGDEAAAGAAAGAGDGNEPALAAHVGVIGVAAEQRDEVPFNRFLGERLGDVFRHAHAVDDVAVEAEIPLVADEQDGGAWFDHFGEVHHGVERLLLVREVDKQDFRRDHPGEDGKGCAEIGDMYAAALREGRVEHAVEGGSGGRVRDKAQEARALQQGHG